MIAANNTNKGVCAVAASGGIGTGSANNIVNADLTADLQRTYGKETLEALVADHSTGKNIIWADDEYVQLDEGVTPRNRGYQPNDEITLEKINGHVIEPRVVKDADRQAWRTKQKAEVFTPSWLCEAMNDRMDAAFLGIEPEPRRKKAQQLPHSAKMAKLFTALTRDNRWKMYVDSRLLEITCGEAPFICSPYDATTGDLIPVRERIGFLDRKLQVVSHFVADPEQWFSWATRALQASYGYEYQGDNLLIARINVFNTIADHMSEHCGSLPNASQAHLLARVISRNLWQMDGLTGFSPAEKDFFDTSKAVQGTLGISGAETDPRLGTASNKATPCKIIFNWQTSSPENKVVKYNDLRKGTSMKKFYGVIGNPPYQEEVEGNVALSIGSRFVDEAHKIGERVELPARNISQK